MIFRAGNSDALIIVCTVYQFIIKEQNSSCYVYLELYDLFVPNYTPTSHYQRIYGTAWESFPQLKMHKKRLEEAKRRDHRTVGKKLNLFSIQEDAGGGMVFWHPKGSIIRRTIEDYWKDEHVKVFHLVFR
jgi:hypothetical protein